jgi:hypothetical protein
MKNVAFDDKSSKLLYTGVAHIMLQGHRKTKQIYNMICNPVATVRIVLLKVRHGCFTDALFVGLRTSNVRRMTPDWETKNESFIIISNLSYDRSTASSKTIPPLNAI